MEPKSDIPPLLKGGAGVAGGGSLLVLAYSLWRDKQALLILLCGVALVGALLLGYRMLLRMREKKKAEQIGGMIAGSAKRPREVTNPEDMAKIADLAHKFEEGLDKFRSAGKNLYSLPWYLLVGEPGSGKTEAIRHSGVPSPMGLGELPGVGGTINMNWWFTNYGVVLDTAGRIMFQQVEAGSTGEWKEFLKLLSRARPDCPINGLMLVIPAESLILDNVDKIREKATKIARQFDVIQRTLGIRFPVFVVITKSDLINGFRSFFDSLTNPQLQGQMLGWSNPAMLDAPFDPDQVDRHLNEVRGRLLKRRMGLLLDPVNSQDSGLRRADEVDDLYAFPDSLLAIAPRLRSYLEMIFVQGEWSPKPLFLRGIYFTSSMRQGSALDKELADALGVPVESLPEGRVWDPQRAYFLRDLFLKKVFPERGLVTRATKASGLHRRRQVAILAAGVTAVLVLLGVSWLGAWQLDKVIGKHRDWWAGVSDDYTKGAKKFDIVAPKYDFDRATGARNLSGYRYRGPDPAFDEGDKTTLLEMHKQAKERVEAPLPVPAVFRPVAGFESNLAAADRRRAYREVYERTVLVPLLNAVREKMNGSTPEQWDGRATDALAQLIRLEVSVHGAKPDSGKPEGGKAAGSTERGQLKLGPLFRYVLSDEEYGRFLADEAMLQSTLTWAYPAEDAAWPPAQPLASNEDSAAAISAGVNTFAAYWRDKRLGGDLAARKGPLNDLRASLEGFAKADEALIAVGAGKPAGPQTLGEYDALQAEWKKQTDALVMAAADVSLKVRKLNEARPGWNPNAAGQSLRELYEAQLLDEINQAASAYRGLRAEIPEQSPPAVLLGARDALDAGRATLPPTDPLPIDPKFLEQLNRLHATYLASAAGGPAPHRLFAQAYLQTNGRLPDKAKGYAPFAATPETWADQMVKLPARLDAVAEETRRAADDLGKSLPGGDHAARVRGACQYAMEKMAVPCRGHLLIKPVVDPALAPKNKDECAAAVAAAARTSTLPDDRPVLALGPVKEGAKLDPRYHRQGGPDLIVAWMKLDPLLQPGAVAPATRPAGGVAVLDAPRLRADHQARTAALTSYADEYVGYWLGVLKDVRTIDAADWKQFKAGLPAAPERVNERLLEVCKVVGEALQNVRPYVPASRAPELDRAMRELAAAREALLKRLPPSTAQTLTLWRALPDNPTNAALAVMATGMAPFAQGYLIAPEGDVATDHWAALTSKGFDLLCKSSGGPDANNPLAACVKNYQSRSPFAPAGAGGVPIKTMEELAAARRDVEAAAASIVALRKFQASLNPPLDDKRLTPAFVAAFKGLGPAAIDPAHERWLARARQILAALPADARQARECTIRTLPLDRQKKLFETHRGTPLAEYQAPRIILGPGANFVDHFAVKPEALGTRRLTPDPNETINFRLTDAPGNTAGLSPPPDPVTGPWAWVEMLYSPNAVMADADGRVWHYRVVQKVMPNNLGARAVWVEVTFDAPLGLVKGK